MRGINTFADILNKQLIFQRKNGQISQEGIPPNTSGSVTLWSYCYPRRSNKSICIVYRLVESVIDFC